MGNYLMSENAQFLICLTVTCIVSKFLIWALTYTNTTHTPVKRMMPCYDCQGPTLFSYGSVETKARCFACYKKHLETFQVRMVPTHQCSLCGLFAAKENDALCWQCLEIHTPLPLTVRLQDVPLVTQLQDAPTRLYTLDSGMRDDA